MYSIADSIVLVIIIAAMAWLVYAMFISTWAYDRIHDNFEYWEGVAGRSGVELSTMPGGYDDSPCEAKFKLEGKYSRVVTGPWTTLKLLRGLRSKRLTEMDLAVQSSWPHSRIPS